MAFSALASTEYFSEEERFFKGMGIYLFLHVYGWIALVLSHEFFESFLYCDLECHPPFKSALYQSIYAPYFVILEMLFSIGYKKKLKLKTNEMIDLKFKKLREDDIK